MRSVAALALALCPAAAIADELWDSPAGQIVYQSEIDDMALLSFPLGDGEGMLYIHGMAGNYDDRGVHYGFWIGDGAGDCAASLTGPDGRSSSDFGSATVVFDDPGFPSGFSAVLVPCMDQFGVPRHLRAEPYQG